MTHKGDAHSLKNPNVLASRKRRHDDYLERILKNGKDIIIDTKQRYDLITGEKI